MLTFIGGEPESKAEFAADTLILTSPSILEPLIMFCTHALRMHDTRCCAVITRVLRNLVPAFQGLSHKNSSSTNLVDENTAAQVREFFCTDVLKACISSLHEPYFTDLQRDLAALVASILVLYSNKTDTPRQVLLSLPGLSEKVVDNSLKAIRTVPSEKQQRAYVLNLLEGVRGVSIYEQGKIVTPRSRPASSRVSGQYMIMDDAVATEVIRGGSPELGGLTDLFS